MKFLTTFYIILFVFVIIQQTTNGIKVERATSSLRRNQQKNLNFLFLLTFTEFPLFARYISPHIGWLGAQYNLLQRC